MNIVGLYDISILWILVCIYFALFLLTIKNRKNINIYIKGINKKTYIILFMIFLIGIIIRISFFHTNIMYMDEPYYLEMAYNFKEIHQPLICYNGDTIDSCYNHFKSPNWPFLLSLMSVFVPLDNISMTWFNSIISCLNVILIFALARSILKNDKIALWSAFLLATNYLFIFWGNTGEMNNAGVAFFMLSLILYFERRTLTLNLPLILVSLLAILTRFENIILLIIIILNWLKKSKVKDYIRTISISIILFILVLATKRIIYPHLILVNEYLLSIVTSIKPLTLDFIYIPFIILGLTKKHTRKTLIGSLMICLVFMVPFYHESRILMLPSIFVILIAGVGLEKISKNTNFRVIAVLLMIILSIMLLTNLTEKKMGLDSFHETGFLKYKIEGMGINELAGIPPKDCKIIGIFPEVMTSFSRHSMIRIEWIEEWNYPINEQIKNGTCYYFLNDLFCQKNKKCQKFMTRIESKVIHSYEEGNYQIDLIKIKKLNESE